MSPVPQAALAVALSFIRACSLIVAPFAAAAALGWTVGVVVLFVVGILVLTRRLGRELERSDRHRRDAEHRLRDSEAAARAESERLSLIVAAQTEIATSDDGCIDRIMAVTAECAMRLAGADGAVIELPGGADLVPRAAVGTPASDAALSGACLPLRHHHEVIGVLKVHAAQADAFGEPEERALELLAGLTGSALARAQAERRLAANHAVARALAEADSLSAGLAGALRGVGEELEWDVAIAWLRTPGGDALECAETWQPDREVAGAYVDACRSHRVECGRGLPGEAWAAGQSLWRNDLVADDPDARLAAAHAAGLRTLVCVPMISHGDVVGAFALGTRATRPAEPPQVELLESVSGQIGQFVKRKLVEERVAQQADHLAAVVELTQTVGGVTDPTGTRPTLVSTMRDVIGARCVALMERGRDGRFRVSAQLGLTLPDDYVVDPEFDDSMLAEAIRLGRGVRASDAADGHDLVIHAEPVRGDALLVAGWTEGEDPGDGADALMRLLAAEAGAALERADLLGALRRGARTDELTGLANRRAWHEELPRELSRAQRSHQPLCVAMLDLDHFKAFNDAHGHQAGDRLLREVAAAWAMRLRATDVVARYGGEEFALALPGCDLERAGEVLEQLRGAMPDGTTCSIGVAQWDGIETGDRLVARADAALYAAKRAGRDRIESVAS